MNKLIPLIIATLVTLWAFFVFRSKLSVSKKKRVIRIDVGKYLKLDDIQREAQRAGWNITKKEFLLIMLFAMGIGIILAVIFKNPLLMIVGFITGFSLPGFLLEKYKKHKRMSLFREIPDPLRLMVSRLPDSENITKAIETTRNELQEGTIMRDIFSQYIQDVAIYGANISLALENMKRRVNIKKFDNFVENLKMADINGKDRAVNALEKTIETMEFDLRAIEKVRLQTAKKKRSIYMVILISWFFPVILSAMHTGNKNIYLYTISGKILMFLYLIGSIYTVIKTDEYLSLNLEEL